MHIDYTENMLIMEKKCKCGYIGPLEMFRKDGKKCKKCHSEYNKRYISQEKEIDYSEIMQDEYMIDLAARMGVELQNRLLTKQR